MSSQFPKKIQSLPPFDGPFDAFKLAATNSDVLFATYPAGTRIAVHSHETDNHGVITRGELTLTMDGRVSTIGVGQWYHVPAHTEHAAFFEVETEEIEFWFKDGYCWDEAQKQASEARHQAPASRPAAAAIARGKHHVAQSQSQSQLKPQLKPELKPQLQSQFSGGELGSGDIEALSARLIREEKSKQNVKPVSGIKVFAKVLAVALALGLLFMLLKS